MDKTEVVEAQVNLGASTTAQSPLVRPDGGLPDHLELSADKRLPHFDTPGGKAYAVVDHRRGDRYLYGLVQKSSIPTRDDVVAKLNSYAIDGLIQPVAQGVAPITIDGDECHRLVTVFDRPFGVSLAAARERGLVSEAYLSRDVLGHLTAVLVRLHELGISHGSIRPSNVFLSDEPGSRPLLGECISAPAGTGQEPAIETIERAMANPWGRGTGGPADDYFSLGATILNLMPGGEEWKEGSPEEELMARLAHGSFAALRRRRRLEPRNASMIAGLMADDPQNRWTAAEITDWLSGITPRVGSAVKGDKLLRPVRFHGQEISDRRILAQVLSRHPKLAARFLRELGAGAVARDLLSGDVRPDELESFIDSNRAVEGSVEKGDQMLVAKIAYLLNPSAPINFRRLDFFPHAVGVMMAKSQADDDRSLMANICSFVAGPLPNELVIAAKLAGRESSDFAEFSSMRRILQSSALGRGQERLLYELNPSLPCQTPRTDDNWIATLGDALRALDTTAGDTGNRSLLDRHICAFASQRNPNLERIFARLQSGDIPSGESAVEMLGIFAALQLKHRSGQLVNLSARFASRLRPAVLALHNRNRRERLSAKLEELSRRGELHRMSRELNFFKEQMADSRDYARARARFAMLEEERIYLGREVEHSDFRAIDRGYSTAIFLGYAALMTTALYLFAGN